MPTLAELRSRVPQVGRVDAVLLRTERRGPVTSVEATRAIAGVGLAGDRREDARPNPEGKRHVTLVQAEHLAVIGAILGRDPVDPVLLRRNLVVSGVNLLALKDAVFTIGEVRLEGTGPCHPCSRMEEALGDGGYAAMRGHGGITARVLDDGEVHVGAPVRVTRR